MATPQTALSLHHPSSPAVKGLGDIPSLFRHSCITVEKEGVGFPRQWAGGSPCCQLWSCARAEIQQTFLLQHQQLSWGKQLGVFGARFPPSPRHGVAGCSGLPGGSHSWVEFPVNRLTPLLTACQVPSITHRNHLPREPPVWFHAELMHWGIFVQANFKFVISLPKLDV